MQEYEKKAELIIKIAYRNGGIVEIEEVLRTCKCAKSCISDVVMTQLDFYGKLGSSTLYSEYSWTFYQLDFKGMEFARKGCFTGERRRTVLTKAGAIAALIAAIVGVLNLFL